jgi:ribosomal protein S16
MPMIMYPTLTCAVHAHDHLQVGTYNPIPTKDGFKEVRFNSDRIRYWIGVGAQPSERVEWLLSQFTILPPKPNRVSAPGLRSLIMCVFACSAMH